MTNRTIKIIPYCSLHPCKPMLISIRALIFSFILVVFHGVNSIYAANQATGNIIIESPAGVNFSNYTGVYMEAIKDDALLLENKIRDSLIQTGFKLSEKLPLFFAPSTGTGFVVGSEGLILTNSHVVRNLGQIDVRFSNGRAYIATILVRDAANDLALLMINDAAKEKFVPLKLGDSTTMQPGAKVFVLGYPLTTLLGKDIHWAEGAIGATSGAAGDPRLFQISVPVQPGNSGSPLFNQNGEVIGVVTSQINLESYKRATGGKALPQALNYAMKINYARLLMEHTGRQYNQNTANANLTTTMENKDSVVLISMKQPAGMSNSSSTLFLRTTYHYDRDTLALRWIKFAFWDLQARRAVLSVLVRDLERQNPERILQQVSVRLKEYLRRKGAAVTN